MSAEYEANTEPTTERVCGGCGEPYAYRVRDRNGIARRFNAAGEYRCDPDGDPYVYFHEIPAEQGVRIPYDVRRDREVRRQ